MKKKIKMGLKSNIRDEVMGAKKTLVVDIFAKSCR